LCLSMSEALGAFRASPWVGEIGQGLTNITVADGEGRH